MLNNIRARVNPKLEGIAISSIKPIKALILKKYLL